MAPASAGGRLLSNRKSRSRESALERYRRTDGLRFHPIQPRDALGVVAFGLEGSRERIGRQPRASDDRLTKLHLRIEHGHTALGHREPTQCLAVVILDASEQRRPDDGIKHKLLVSHVDQPRIVRCALDGFEEDTFAVREESLRVKRVVAKSLLYGLNSRSNHDKRNAVFRKFGDAPQLEEVEEAQHLLAA